MRVKVRGYEGTLVELQSVGDVAPDGKYTIDWCKVRIVPDNNTVMTFYKVLDSEIEVI